MYDAAHHLYSRAIRISWRDLARKNAKFTMKLSATHHAALEECGESRLSNTLTVTLSLS